MTVPRWTLPASEKTSSGLPLKPTDLPSLLTEQIAHLRPFLIIFRHQARARAVAWRASCAPRNDDRSASSLAGHPCSDHWRSRVPARNREYRTPRVGRSHFGGGGSGSRSAVPTYPQPPHKWTTSPDSGRTGGSLRASRIASPHWGHRGAVSGSLPNKHRTEWSMTDIACSQCGVHFPPSPLDSPILQPHVPKS